MPTIRKHPNRYSPAYYKSMQEAITSTVRINYNSPNEAKKMRMYFYGAREALRKFQEYNSELAAYMNGLHFKVEESALIITYTKPE